jgi:hypothetical protein
MIVVFRQLLGIFASQTGTRRTQNLPEGSFDFRQIAFICRLEQSGYLI